jgi:cardiolipin synthase
MKALHESQLDQKATAEASSTVLSDQVNTCETLDIPRESHAGSDTRVRFILNIPNVLTIIRLLAVVPLAILISCWPEKRLITVFIFAGIWVTDILDGFIARRFNMMTQFGKLFDPFVDKVFQVVTVIMLFSIGLVPLWVPLFYVLRETFMLFASTVLLTKHRVVVYSDLLGKFSTFLFVVAVGVIYLFPTEKAWLRNYVFILPVLTSFIATIHYGVIQLRSMRAANDGDRL